MILLLNNIIYLLLFNNPNDTIHEMFVIKLIEIFVVIFLHDNNMGKCLLFDPIPF